MKSKPPNKKSRLDTDETVPTTTATTSSSSTSTKKDGSALLSSSTSSSSASVAAATKAATAVTASEIFAAAKLAAAASVAALAGQKQRIVTHLPSFPKLSVPDLMNPKEFTKVGQLAAAAAGIKDNRPPDSVAMEDIDMIQQDLERLWSNISVRIRCLQREQAALQNSPNVILNRGAVLGEHFDPHHQDKMNAVATIIDAGHGTRTSVSAAAKLVMGSQIPQIGTSANVQLPGSSRKAGSTTSSSSSSSTTFPSIKLEKHAKKKVKGESEPKSKRAMEKPARAGQNRTHSMSQDDSSLLRQEAPSQFWDFCHSYCQELTQENLDALDNTIKEHNNALPGSLFKIPPLGKHFNSGGGGGISSSLGGAESPSSGTGTNSGGIRAGEKVDTISRDICGPLTQRLVAALVDDRVSSYNHLASSNGNREESNEGCFIHRPGLVRALGLDGSTSGSGPPLETRLRQVLLEQGLLLGDDAEDSALINPDDEILADIKRTQSNLKMIHTQNADKLRELHSLATRELERNVIKKDLEKADKEVLEAYRLISSCRLKKKSLTKRERDIVFRALENRNTAIVKLQAQPQLSTTSNFSENFST